jgi:hypothetical protein
MPRKAPTEGSRLSSRSKSLAATAIVLGTAQACLGLSGTGPDGPDELGDGGNSREPPSSDAGAKYGTDASDGDSLQKDAASPPDASTAETGSQKNEDDGAPPTPDTGMPVAPDAGQTTSNDAGQDAGGTFSSLVQLTIGAFNANTVSTTATGGVALTSMDGHTLTTDGNDFATQSKVASLGGVAGLPDDGVFPGSGTAIPPLQFGWSNATNNENTLLVASNAPTAYAFDVPAGPSLGYFQTLQIYGTGTNGAQTVNYTLTYTTGAATLATVTVADWCASTPLPSGTSKLVSADRIHSTGVSLSDSDGFLCSIYAVNIPVDPSRVLSQFSFTDVGVANSYLALYGLAAW